MPRAAAGSSEVLNVGVSLNGLAALWRSSLFTLGLNTSWFPAAIIRLMGLMDASVPWQTPAEAEDEPRCEFIWGLSGLMCWWRRRRSRQPWMHLQWMCICWRLWFQTAIVFSCSRYIFMNICEKVTRLSGSFEANIKVKYEKKSSFF